MQVRGGVFYPGSRSPLHILRETARASMIQNKLEACLSVLMIFVILSCLAFIMNMAKLLLVI